MQRSVSAGVLAGMLRDLSSGRKSGLLHLTRGEERTSIRFHGGRITHASSNVAADGLGESLVRLGRLSRDDHDRCAELMRREGKRLDQALVGLALMSQEQAEQSLALHVRELLLKIFAWEDGSYRFEEGPEEPGVEDVTRHLSTSEMILEAVRRVRDPLAVRQALGEIDRVLAHSSDPLLRSQKLALSPVEGFLLSRVDGTTSAREVISLAPVASEQAEKGLLGLLYTGIVEFLPGLPKAQRVQIPTGHFDLRKLPGYQPPAAEPAGGAPHLPTTPEKPGAAPKAAPGPAVGPSTPAAPATRQATGRFDVKRLTGRFKRAILGGPPAADPEQEKALQARRQEILEMAEGLKAKSHYEVLGIPRASNESQVKEAYFKLAKRFHPDIQRDAALKDLAGPIEAIFIRIGEAYETLRNPRTRAAYEERLGRQANPPAAGATLASSARPERPAQAPGAPTEPTQPGDAGQRIEEAVRRAERLLAQEKYWDVIQAIEPHLEQARGRLKARAQLLIAKAYIKNPHWVKRAEVELQHVVQAEPNNLDALVLLGGIYKRSGLGTRAASMFRKVLEVNPDHPEAAQALAELGVPPSEERPTQPGGPSLLKRVFKKG